MVGMNALGLPGASIDGILRLHGPGPVQDRDRPHPQDRMTWTRLDFEPREPFVPRGAMKKQSGEMQAMNVLGPMAKLAAAIVGKQPEEQLHPRGFLGDRAGRGRRRAEGLGGPGRLAGLRSRREGRRPAVQGGRANRWTPSRPLRLAVAEVREGDKVALGLLRDGEGDRRDLDRRGGFLMMNLHAKIGRSIASMMVASALMAGLVPALIAEEPTPSRRNRNG